MQHLPYSKIIRFFREEQKLTLRQLSDLTFFGFQTLSKYETELIPLSDENFEVVAKALGMTVADAQAARETDPARHLPSFL